MDLEAGLDELYRAPLAKFVATRNELAKQLRKSGDRETADRVKKLAKPPLTAWAVNQLAFRAAEELAALADAGAAMRAAHLASAAEQQTAAKTRRDAVSALLASVGELFAETGQALGAAHRQRIARTLEALSSYGPESDKPRAGRLSQDLEPAGFDALADLAAALGQAQAARPKGPKLAKVIPITRARTTAGSPESESQEPVLGEPTGEAGQDPSHQPVEPRADQEARQRQAERQEAEQREAERREAERRAAEERATRRRELESQLAEARRTLQGLELRVQNLAAANDRAGSHAKAASHHADELAAAAQEAERRALMARKEAEEASRRAHQAEVEAETATTSLREAEKGIAEGRQRVDQLSAEHRKLC